MGNQRTSYGAFIARLTPCRESDQGTVYEIGEPIGECKILTTGPHVCAKGTRGCNIVHERRPRETMTPRPQGDGSRSP